jgi:hypothetical protein
VVGFEKEAEAPALLGRNAYTVEGFSLSLHPKKTRLIEFGRFAAVTRRQRGLGKPETFRFLGFTFICGESPVLPDLFSAAIGEAPAQRSSRNLQSSSRAMSHSFTPPGWPILAGKR